MKLITIISFVGMLALTAFAVTPRANARYPAAL